MIEADQLTKFYGRFAAARDVSFTVQPGEILGFLGPNGAGKSTTMKMLTGFLAPSRGTARLGGFDVQTAPREAKALLGYLPESGPLYPEMTVGEFLRFAAALRGLRGAAAKPVLDRVVGLCHLESVWTQTIETLSKGFRQRVGLAQAILHEPRALILDEPTDGLDPNQKQEVRSLLAGMAADKAVILSTHILEEVEAMCTRIIIIDEGRVIADETPEALRRRHPLAEAVVLELAEEPADAEKSLNELAAVQTASRDGLKWTLTAQQDRASLAAAVGQLARQEGWAVTALAPAPTPLDAVFRQLTSDKAA